MIRRVSRVCLKEKNGFTLTEILLVVAIIALVATLSVPNFLQHTRRARASEAVASMSMIRMALRDFNIKLGAYYDIIDSVTPGQGNIDNAPPASTSDINLATGVPNPTTAGVEVDLKVVQYFSNSAFTVDAINHTSARFTSPGPVDFVITADGSKSNPCGTSNCAVNQAVVDDFRLEMDNTGRTFVSFDGGANWASY